MNPVRRTTQLLAPTHAPAPTPGEYELHPSHPLPHGRIDLGFDALAARLPGEGVVLVDGDPGTLWEDLRGRLEAALKARGGRTTWFPVDEALQDAADIERWIAPYLGGEDPIFGRRFSGRLEEFFAPGRLADLGRRVAEAARETGRLVIVFGCGAALVPVDVPRTLALVELPKNEQQFRARAGVPVNLGSREARPPKPAYKRSYFIDWPAVKAHKKALSGQVDLVVDGQRPESPAVVSGADLRAGLAGLAAGGFRVRPWFEPGPWGGQWCKRHLPVLPPAPNYAWSFELIAPENGLTFRDDSGRLLEVSFDWLLLRHSPEVLGDASAWFDDEFPIRFDFLDTVEGGNLSVQVHPAPDYIRRHFGEKFTQDETYYILDATPEATVNLGFREGIDPAAFRGALETSFASATPLDMPRYVQVHPARRGDLFLIPHGTIHGAGTGCLVLEISATPYIFTFKLYDWLRPDLDGKPRPLNLERGMANLDFTRSGAGVAEEFLSRPREIARAVDGRAVTEELPTHRDHFYAVYRHRFHGEIEVPTDGSVQVMSLVEGRQVEVITRAGDRRTYAYAETFVVCAAAGRFRLRALDGGEVIVVRSRMKPASEWPGWMTGSAAVGPGK